MEFLNIKTQRLWKYLLMTVWFSIMSSYILMGKFGGQQFLSHLFILLPLWHWTREWWKPYVHVLISSTVMEILPFGRNGLSENGFPFFWRTDDFCFVKLHTYFITIQKKKKKCNISKRKIYINCKINMIPLHGISFSIWLVLHGGQFVLSAQIYYSNY